MGTLLNKSMTGQYRLLMISWSLHFKDFPLFPVFLFTSPAGNKSAQFVSNRYLWMLMQCPWETTLLCSTRELQNPTTNQCIKGSLEHWTLGSFVKHTQPVCTHTNTIQCRRCLAAWGSVNIKTHNQREPFKVLQMLTTNGQYFGQSALSPRAAAASGIHFNNPQSEQSFYPVSLCLSHLVNMSLSKHFCDSNIDQKKTKKKTSKTKLKACIWWCIIYFHYDKVTSWKAHIMTLTMDKMDLWVIFFFPFCPDMTTGEWLNQGRG